MSDPTLRSVELLDDPSRWVVVAGVPAFDVHDEDIWVPETDAAGNQIKGPDGKLKRKKEKWVCDEQELAEICRVNNARATSTGDYTPITIGHTDDDAPETEQPPIIGFAKNWRVGEFGPMGKKAALNDWYIEKGKEHLLKKFPRRSVELWRNSKIVDPISLLGARTPERDLGLLLTYCRRPDRVRYSMETMMNAEPEVPPGTEGGPETMGGTGEGTYTPEMHHEYMKHCYSHKYAKMHHSHMLKKYEMVKPETEEETGAPAPEETPGTPPPEETPLRNAAGPGMPGTADVPSLTKVKPMGDAKGQEKYRRNGDQRIQPVARDTVNRFSALEGEIQAMRAEIAATKRENASLKTGYADLLKQSGESAKERAELARQRDLERYSAHITKLVNEEFVDLDDDEIKAEAAEIVGMADQAARDRRMEKIKTKYSKRPDNRRIHSSLFQLDRPVEGGVTAESDEPRDEAEYNAAISYATNHPDEIDLKAGDPMGQAVKKYRASRNRPNGSK